MVRKIILVGQAPSQRSKEPLDGASGRKLASLAGLDLADFLNRFERVNLLDAWPGGGPHKGDRFDLAAARERADQLRERWAGRKAVLLGKGVMAAFRLLPEDAEWFHPVEVHPGLEVACMPHPSGISYWWNDPANVERARQFMLRLNLGFLALKRGSEVEVQGRPQKFSPEQVGAALVAADGILLHASRILAEETGIKCDRQTVQNYCERYPALAEVRDDCRQKIGDIAENNILAAVRAGDADLSLKLLRSKAFAGRGYELMVEGRLKHEGSIDHRHAHLHAKLGELDLNRYNADQLAAIEDFARLLGETPGGVDP